MIIPERIIEVRIGPPGGQGRLFRSPFHIEAEIELTSGRKPNKATVKLYNISKDSVAYVGQTGNVVQVSAGVGVVAQIFHGDVTTRLVSTVEKDGNRVTTIKAGDGQRRWREADVSLSYPPGIERGVVLGEVLAGMSLPTGYVAQLPAKTYANGWAFVGRARDALDDLLDGQASWSIQDGAVQILLDGERVPGNALVVSAATGLIGSPERADKGVKFSFGLNSMLRPGRGVLVQSKWYQGELKLTKVHHKASVTEHWQSDCMGVPI